jgi:glycosyltransferase involved in cell wall biosynthesis
MTSAFVAPPPPEGFEPGDRPTFSIVIPTYQAADLVGDAVESALAQTQPALEVIVVDDGSTDATADVLRHFGERITVIRKENGGEASAKNAGITAARGDFVAILDADDVFLPRRIQRLADLAAARPDLDLLTTDAFVVVGGQQVRRCFTEQFPFAATGQRAAILRANFLPFAAVRRQAAVEIGLFDERLRHVPDWDLWLRMILAGARAGMVPEPLAEYRIRPTSVSSDRTRLHRGKLETLQRAAARTDLTPDERAIVDDGISAEQREVALWAARDAIHARAPEARRLCLALAFRRDVGLRARVNALAGAIAPGMARRRLRDREGGSRELAAGVRGPDQGGGIGDTEIDP